MRPCGVVNGADRLISPSLKGRTRQRHERMVDTAQEVINAIARFRPLQTLRSWSAEQFAIPKNEAGDQIRVEPVKPAAHRSQKFRCVARLHLF